MGIALGFVGADLFLHQPLLLLGGAVPLPHKQGKPLGPGLIEHGLQIRIDPAGYLLSVGEGGKLYGIILRQGVIPVDQKQVSAAHRLFLLGRKQGLDR